MSATEFRLSTATPDDRERLLRLHKKVRVESDSTIVGAYAEATSNAGYYEDLWYEHFPKDGVTVTMAEADGKLAGFARCGAPCFAEYPEEYPDDELAGYKYVMGELHQIYIDKNFQNRGLGKLLYLAALRHLRESGYKHLFTATFKNNVNARLFYESMGARFHFDRIDRCMRGDKPFANEVVGYIHEDIDRMEDIERLAM